MKVNDVVELGLRKPGIPAAGADLPLKALAEAFLKLFADGMPDAETDDVKAFAATLQEARAEIALSEHEQEVRRLASRAIRACEQFLKQSRQYYKARETELTDMIAILRETAKHLAGDSTEFDDRMRIITDRLHGMSQLDDIRELKKQLVEETHVLQRTVEARSKRDQEAVSKLTARVKSLQTDLVEAEEQASVDPLTRVANRGAFDRAIVRLITMSRNSPVPVSLAMLDIDRFKAINDEHGHLIGDRVLLCAAQWLTAAVRRSDLVARYGGEEFAVILNDADLTAAEARFKTVLEQIASRSFEYDVDGQTRSVRFTMSCGVAQLTVPDTEADVIKRADEALYAAKRGGRNRVVAKKRSKLSGLFG